MTYGLLGGCHNSNAFETLYKSVPVADACQSPNKVQPAVATNGRPRYEISGYSNIKYTPLVRMYSRRCFMAGAIYNCKQIRAVAAGGRLQWTDGKKRHPAVVTRLKPVTLPALAGAKYMQVIHIYSG